MLRYIQVHIISTILSESIFLISEIGDTECVYVGYFETPNSLIQSYIEAEGNSYCPVV